MTVEEIIGALTARFQAERRRQAITRGDTADGLAGIVAGEENLARTHRGAGIAVILMTDPLQHQTFQIHLPQQALPVAAEFAALDAGDGVKTRSPIAVIAHAAGEVRALDGEVVVPFPAPQRRDQS